MSGFEALMWELERDPHLSSSFANLTVLDRPPDRRRFRARMAAATHAVPRLRERVVSHRFGWEHPEWVEDPDFDLDHHLRWVDLGGDADDEQLHQLAAELSGHPFDRERPLWEFVTIEGLRGGRAAMLQRLHHTITDGEGGVRLSVQFLDLERDAEGPMARPQRPGTDLPAEHDAPPADSPSWLGGAVQAVAGLATGARDLAGGVASGVVELPARGGQLTGAARSTLRQAMVGQRRSPLWTERSLRRWFGTTVLSLDEVRTAAHHLGGSVNDLFMAGAATAAGRVHDRHGHPVDELRVSMPVSTRHDRSAGGNAFSPTQMLVPTGDMSPTERFDAVRGIIGGVRAESAINAMEGAANAASRLPSAALVRTGQHLAGSVDFVCSNVRAAPFDLYIGGALLEANYPLGPLAGTSFNLTTMSYRGRLFLGLLADTAAVQDPEELLEELVRAYDELLRAGGVDPAERTG